MADRGALAVAAGQLGRDLRVGALDLVRHGLAEIVQERSALRGLHRRLDLGGHDARELHDLERVLEHVLAVARPVAQPAEDLHELLAELAAVRLEDRLLAGLPDVLVELGLRQVVHLLDPGRVDAPVLDQLQQRHARDLSPDAVEGREDDGVRRVVDDEVDAGEVLERPDVAAFPADDAALHVVGGQLDERDGRLCRCARSNSLQRIRNEVASPALRLGRASSSICRTRPASSWRTCSSDSARIRWRASPVVIDAIRSSSPRWRSFSCFISSCSWRRWISRSATPCSRRASSVSFAVDVVLLRDHALLDLDDLVAPLAQLRLELGAQLDRLLARLDRRLAPRRLGVALGLVEQQRRAARAGGVEPRSADQAQRDQRAADADRECDHNCHDDEHGRSYGLGRPHDALAADRRIPARSRAPFGLSQGRLSGWRSGGAGGSRIESDRRFQEALLIGGNGVVQAKMNVVRAETLQLTAALPQRPLRERLRATPGRSLAGPAGAPSSPSARAARTSAAPARAPGSSAPMPPVGAPRRRAPSRLQVVPDRLVAVAPPGERFCARRRRTARRRRSRSARASSSASSRARQPTRPGRGVRRARAASDRGAAARALASSIGSRSRGAPSPGAHAAAALPLRPRSSTGFASRLSAARGAVGPRSPAPAAPAPGSPAGSPGRRPDAPWRNAVAF